MFVGVHTMLAHATGRLEWQITEEEGKNFMDRAQAVARHYSVQSTQKTLDWIAFGGTCFAIYGPRIVAVAANRKNERRGIQPTNEDGQQSNGYMPSVVPGEVEAAE